MIDVQSPATNQRKSDLEQLTLLWAFHLVGAGLAVVGLIMLYGHYTFFNDMMSNPKLWQQQGGPSPPPPPHEIFAAVKWIYFAFALVVGGTGGLNLVSALFIRAKKHRLFSLVVAGINCFYMPLGTALGIFTIVVLVRDSVRDLYETGMEMVRA